MKPLIVLLLVFGISLLVFKVTQNSYQWTHAGRIAMSAMLVFTAIGHFKFTQGMAMMLPESTPYRIALVRFTGVAELAAAIGLLVAQFRVMTGWALIIFFILILPTNIYAAVKHVNIEKGTYDGDTIKYLWFRIPLQIVFMIWVFISSIR